MKIKHLNRYLICIGMTALLALWSGNAFGDVARTTNATTDFNDGDGDYANNFMVTSPYWQVEGGSSYTFIAVSHSSLSGMASQIGVVINAIDSTGTAYDTAESFTVVAGNTQRVFIVPTNHATINSSNISSAVFLSGTTDYTYGHIRINPQTSHPQLKVGGAVNTGSLGFGGGFRDSTMLAYWGSVIVEANTTGFAMEFIGDVNDSLSWITDTTYNTHFLSDGTYGAGVNIQ